jgi:hypothetical protein
MVLKTSKTQVAPPVERRSLKLTPSDWFLLQELAEDTKSCYRGKSTWRRLIARIARGEIVLTVVKPSAPSATPVKVVKRKRVEFQPKPEGVETGEELFQRVSDEFNRWQMDDSPVETLAECAERLSRGNW